MKDEHRDRKGFGLALLPGDGGGHFGRESRSTPPVEQGVGQNRLDHGGVSRQSAEVHSYPQGKTRGHPGKHPAQGHKDGWNAELAERRGRGDDTRQTLGVVQAVLEDDQSSEAVSQDEEREVGVPISHSVQKTLKILSVLIPAPDVRPLTG